MIRYWDPAGFWEEWHCEPPPSGWFYVRPGGEQWTQDHNGAPVRQLLRVEWADEP